MTTDDPKFTIHTTLQLVGLTTVKFLPTALVYDACNIIIYPFCIHNFLWKETQLLHYVNLLTFFLDGSVLIRAHPFNSCLIGSRDSLHVMKMMAI